MKRRKSKSVIARNQALLEEIKAIKTDHSLWGYRRIWAYLKYRQGFSVNRKRIYRLMKEENLLVTKNERLKARRGPLRAKPHAEYPNHFWGIDMTKIKLLSWGWLYLVIVLDWYTKEIVGYSLGLQSKTEDWLKALNQAVNQRFPEGIKDSVKERLFIVSDNGCQPTSQRFMKNCAILGIKQIFTTWSNPKGNSDTERVLRTLKEDLVWLHDWEDPFELEGAMAQWIDAYNTDFPHQSLGNLTPKQYHEAFVLKEPTHLKSA